MVLCPSRLHGSCMVAAAWLHMRSVACINGGMLLGCVFSVIVLSLTDVPPYVCCTGLT